jgi:hypothetical protein
MTVTSHMCTHTGLTWAHTITHQHWKEHKGVTGLQKGLGKGQPMNRPAKLGRQSVTLVCLTQVIAHANSNGTGGERRHGEEEVCVFRRTHAYLVRE